MTFPFENKLWFKGTTALGVEVFLEDDRGYSYHFVELQREKDEVRIVEHADDFESFVNDGRIKQSVPLAVIVSGTGIVVRQIDKLDDASDPEYFESILSNAKLEDFYFQRLSTENDKEIVALVRKNVLDKLTNELSRLLEKSNLSVTHFYLGPGIASRFINFSNTRQGSFTTRAYSISLEQGRIIEITKNDGHCAHDLRFDSETLNQYSVLPYFAALSFFAHPANLSIFFSNKQVFKKHFVFGRLYDLLKWPVLVALFLMFLINYFLFDSYSTRLSALSHETYASQNMELKVDSMRQLCEKKRLFVEQASDNSAPFSFFVDRIMQFVPKSVVLSYCSVFPIDGKVKDGEKPMQSNLIVIRGYTNYSLDLNHWINQLKKEEWIQVVNISNYNYQSEEQSGNFEMLIEIVESKRDLPDEQE